VAEAVSGSSFSTVVGLASDYRGCISRDLRWRLSSFCTAGVSVGESLLFVLFIQALCC
jgi:hypothetical protein